MTPELGQEQHRITEHEQTEQPMLDLARVAEQYVKSKVTQ